MSHPLRCARRVGKFWLPKLAAFGSDSLAIVMTLTALFAGGAISCGEDIPESVVLDFTATWCGPCQQMSPIVHKLQKQGYAIRKVDVDQQQSLARSYGVTSIPTFVLVVNGQEMSRVSGITSEDQLRRMALQAGQQKTPPKKSVAPNPAPVYIADNAAEPMNDSRPLEVADLSDASTSFDSPAPSKKAAKPKKPFSLPKLPPLFGSKDTPLAETGSKLDGARVRGKPPEFEETLQARKNDPLAASARIRVMDETGANFGSGTIIDSRVGRTIILTCGHLFKPPTDDENAAPKTVEVDIFLPGGRHEMYPGKLIHYDLDGDVGVITINTAGALSCSPIAPLIDAPAVQTQLMSIGCGGGEQPAKEAVRVTAINRYDGPDNIECTGMPVQGRSGGGLFDSHGQLVGVCIAADQEGRRGLYAGLKPIHDLLSQAGLKHVLPPTAVPKEEPAEPTKEEIPLVAETNDKPGKTKSGDSILDQAFSKDELDWLNGRGVPSTAEIADLFTESPDAEVICIVRPKNGAADRVVILNQASTKFVSYLLDSVESPRSAPQNASLRVEDASGAIDTITEPDAVGIPKSARELTNDIRPKSSSRKSTKPTSRFGARAAD